MCSVEGRPPQSSNPGRDFRAARSFPPLLRPFMALSLLAALMVLGSEPAFSQDQPLEISADALGWEFAADEDVASQKYRNKKLVLTGRVTNIRLINDHPVLEFEAIRRYNETLHKSSSLKTHIDRKTKEVLESVRYESVVYYLDPRRTDLIEEAVVSVLSFRDDWYERAPTINFEKLDEHQLSLLRNAGPDFTVECELIVSPGGVYDRDQRPGTCRMK